jgi:hypothetical protein
MATLIPTVETTRTGGRRALELRETRLVMSYGAGGRLRVEFALDADGRLMGRYLPIVDLPAGVRRDPSDWLERRELEDSDEEHVRLIGALREVLDQYSEAENL